MSGRYSLLDKVLGAEREVLATLPGTDLAGLPRVLNDRSPRSTSRRPRWCWPTTSR